MTAQNNNQTAIKNTDKKVWQTPKIIEVISCMMTAGTAGSKGDGKNSKKS